MLFHCSRNSFISSYSGSFKVVEVEAMNLVSASNIRREIGNSIGTSEDFRKGIIYATQHNYPLF